MCRKIQEEWHTTNFEKKREREHQGDETLLTFQTKVLHSHLEFVYE